MDPVADDLKEKGNKCMKEDKFIEGMLYYTQAIQADPDNPTYYSNRSLAFLKMQQYYFALADADEVIKRMPKWTKGHFRKGEVQMGAEHYEQAMQSYKKALETDPQDPTLNKSLDKAILLYKEQTKKEKRIAWFAAVGALVVSMVLVVADEAIATKNAILQSDMSRFIVVSVITAIGYLFGVFYRYFVRSQRCSLLDPPVDLLPEEKKKMGIPDFRETKEKKETTPPSKPKGNAKQRKKGRS